MLVYGECEWFVMQMLYVCVLCASCGSSQCCVLHDLQFVNAGRGCNRRPYIGVAMGSVLLFIVRSRLLTFCRVWCEQSAGCFVWI